MNVLITGGAGFIGSHTTELMIQKGIPVTVFDNLSTGKLSNLKRCGDANVVEGDICDMSALKRAIAGATHVIHLAAQVSVQQSISNPIHSQRTNIVGFLNVLEAARENGINRLVYASSAAVYGTPAKLPLDDSTSASPLSPYGLEKYINDQYATLYRTLHGISTMGLRYFNVYGERQDPKSPYSGVISKFLDASLSGEPVSIFGDGTQSRDFIYVKDIARVNLAALCSNVVGTANVATGNSISLNELLDVISQVNGRYVERSYEPAKDGDIKNSSVSIDRLNQLITEPMIDIYSGLSKTIENRS